MHLADDDVIRRRVVVELLVPLLHPVALALGKLVTVHDVQDLVADGLTVPTAPTPPDAAEHEPEKRLFFGVSILPPPSNELIQVLRRRTELPRLGVVIPLPRQLSDLAEPQPHKDHRDGVNSTRGGAINERGSGVVAVHERDGAARFLAKDLLGNVGPLPQRIKKMVR